MKRILMTCLMMATVGFGATGLAQTPEVQTATPTVDMFADPTPLSPELQSAQAFETQAYQAMRQQNWTQSTAAFQKFEKESLKAHHPMTSQQYLDWARVAYFAGNLTESQETLQKASKATGPLSKAQMEALKSDLTDAQQDTQAYQQQLQQIKEGTFAHADLGQPWGEYLMVALMFLALGGGLTAVVLRRSSRRVARGLYHAGPVKMFDLTEK